MKAKFIYLFSHQAADLPVTQRLSTGIRGLDSLIEGGIPKGYTVLVAGNPGTGKTILTAHFLYEGLTNGNNEPGLYISFSETDEQFLAATERLGMDFRKFQKDNKFTYLDLSAIRTKGLQDALDEIMATMQQTGVKRIILDSFSAIFQAAEGFAQSRDILNIIFGKIARMEGVTTMMTVEVPVDKEGVGSGIEEFIADGIIRLEHGKDNASPIFINVLKMRGTNINREAHTCTIDRKGMVVYPKHKLNLNYPSMKKRIRSGVYGLDERIDGGILAQTTTVVMGAAGVGKTVFALHFVAEGVKNGEPGIFCSVEETADEIRLMARGLGYDNIEELERRGLKLLARSTSDQNPDSLIAELADWIKETKAKRLVVDSISAFQYKYRDELYPITKRLGSMARENDATLMLTALTEQGASLTMSEIGISSAVHNVILLRYIELESQLKRTLIVLKMRATNNDTSILEFTIEGKRGLRISGSMEGYFGILTGIPQKAREEFLAGEQKIADKQEMERKARLVDFEAREKDIARQQRAERKRREEGKKKRGKKK
jgi:circadian clock protein KaiC